ISLSPGGTWSPPAASTRTVTTASSRNGLSINTYESYPGAVLARAKSHLEPGCWLHRDVAPPAEGLRTVRLLAVGSPKASTVTGPVAVPVAIAVVGAGAAGTAVRTPGATSTSGGAAVPERRRCAPDVPRSTVDTAEARPWELGTGQYQACDRGPEDPVVRAAASRAPCAGTSRSSPQAADSSRAITTANRSSARRIRHPPRPAARRPPPATPAGSPGGPPAGPGPP